MPFTYDADVCFFLCDTLQSNIVNVIFVEDGNYLIIFIFICRVASGAKICDFFVELWANTSN